VKEGCAFSPPPLLLHWDMGTREAGGGGLG
jgi:hypothetical protein